MEIVIVTLLSSLLIAALLRFLVAGYPLYRITYLQQQSTESARLHLKRIVKELREVRPSDTGAYPLVEMSPNRIVFYANIDDDAVTERVSYELSGTDLVRRVLEPSGIPLIYDESNVTTNIISRNIRNTSQEPLFLYYSGDYPDDQTQLAPVDVTEVKYIQFFIKVDVDEGSEPPPIEVRSQVQLRNLKTNHGETTEEQD